MNSSHLAQPNLPNSLHIDPVCGMEIEDSFKLTTAFQNKNYFFCSEHCRKSFLSHPTNYLDNKFHPKSSTQEQTHQGLVVYYPLILILIYLMGGTVLAEIEQGNLQGMRMMIHFMGGFFIVFSFFKFLNLRGFANAYQTYDIIAKAIPIYAWIYPFIELGLGIAYLNGSALWNTHLATLIVMSVSSMGVAKSLLKKNKIECACLGTAFKLPMTKITLFEDLIMAGMALMGLISIRI